MQTVGIVLRTSKRYIFLDRALKDIMNQEYKSWIIILVNDGGDRDIITKLIEQNQIPKEQISILSNELNKGLQKAINLGAKAVKTPIVVVHDDDDTWDKKFLSSTVEYLEKHENCKGVITHTNQIVEKVVGNEIRKVKSRPFNHELKGVISIYDMLKNNQFPPISFVYKTEVYDEVGYFDEHLEVLEDWDFYLRFLMKYDIHIIEKPLANYHIRNQSNIQEVFKNTVTSRKVVHQRYDTIIRNKYFRDDIESGKIGIGVMLNTIKWSDGKIIKKIRKVIKR